MCFSSYFFIFLGKILLLAGIKMFVYTIQWMDGWVIDVQRIQVERLTVLVVAFVVTVD